MPRNLTDPNYDGTFEWQERVVDPDGDSLSFTVTVDGTDISNVSWAAFTTTTNSINGGETEVLLDFTADRSGLTEGQTYQFEVIADDGLATVSRTFALDIAGSLPAGSYFYPFEYRERDDGSFGWVLMSYSLGTPFDLSTKTEQFSLEPTNNSIKDVEVSGDNSSIYILDGSDVQVWNMNSNDLSTATLDNTVTLSNLTNPFGFSFVDGGSKLIVVDRDDASIHQWSLSNPYDVSNRTKDGKSSTNLNIAGSPIVRDSGTKLYVTDFASYEVVQFDISSSFDITSGLTEVNRENLGNNVWGLHVSNDGNALWVTKSEDIYKYDLNTTWDLSTLNQVNSYNTSGTTGRGIAFSN